MRARRPPRLDKRRESDFVDELVRRSQAWIPSWGLDDDKHDFGRALLEIAARFDSEVAERLDECGEKMRRGFLDWLGVRGLAARPARVPVVFKITDGTQDVVLAAAPVTLQADANGVPVIFETEKDLNVVPGKLHSVIGIDAQNDSYYLPPPGLSDLDKLEPLPTQWRLRGFAAAGSNKLQLEPDTGLVAGTIIQAGDFQYEVIQVENEIVTILPALESDLQAASSVTKVATFIPYGGAARNQQEHALYLGHTDLLNIESSGTIEVSGAQALVTGFTWQYWGKTDGSDESDWQTLEPLPSATSGAINLKKLKGEVEPLLIGTTNSRWIRAFAETILSDFPLLHVDALDLRINPETLKDCDSESTEENNNQPKAEAMANTTPLVLDNIFFPLGLEPRQFDAFYLGCEEAFSKKSAEVKLCLKMAEPRFSGLSTLRSGPRVNTVLADVAENGFLYLLSVNEGVVTPKGNASGLVEGPEVRLDSKLPFRLPIWGRGTEVFVAAVARDKVFLRTHDTGNNANDKWRQLGTVGKVGSDINDIIDARSEIDGLVFLSNATNGQLFALRESKLFVHDLINVNTNWKIVPPVVGTINLTRIAPILIENGSSVTDGSVTHGLVGVADDGKLYEITGLDSASPSWTATARLTGVAIDITPAAIRSNRLGDSTIAVAVGKVSPAAWSIKAYRSGGLEDSIPLQLNKVFGGSVDVNLNDGHLHFSICVENASNVSELITWSPFDPDDHAPLVRRNLSASGFTPSGAPTLLPEHVVIPTNSNQVIVSEFKVRRITTAHKTALITASALPVATNVPVAGDGVAICLSKNDRSYQLANVPTGETVDERTLFEFAFASEGGSTPDLDVFIDPSIGTIADPAKLDEIQIDRNCPELAPNTPLIITTDQSTQTYIVDSFNTVSRIAKLDRNLDVSISPPTTVDYRFVGTTIANRKKIKINANAPSPSIGDFLLITTDLASTPTRLYEIVGFNSSRKIVTLDRDLEVHNPASPPATVDYRLPMRADAQLRPLLHLDAATGNWNAALLEDQPLLFPGAKPREIRAIAFSRQPGTNYPKYIALDDHWEDAPPSEAGNIVFWIDRFPITWNVFLGDTTTNPELSWEYWNGTGWWRLRILQDATQNLKTTGQFKFEVPDDIEPTDWAGRVNFWIRARLVGGDYGKETVTVVTTPDGITQRQTVIRSNDGIRAPSVLSLRIAYDVTVPVQPTHVLAQDSGTIRDQSDANRTAGAIVEAFVPLSVTLRRLERTTQQSARLTQTGNRDCECHDDRPVNTNALTSANDAKRQSPASTRALFLGIDGPISGATVNLLMLVDERFHNDLAPLRIDALVANQFVPIVSSDATRALGESGLISMTFAVPPTPSELFGRSLRWLRLSPQNAQNASDWLPSLRGVYLNAIWASATETLTRELLGSSTGQPNLVVTLARPPVLHDSLELRVRENLSKEERESLLHQSNELVLSDVENLAGDWVLWKQVVDPLDEPASARVYSLDEETGEIRFGDGINGMIPPTGRDAIVAFRYRRTESGNTESDTVPGNLITARTEMNLVSPVSGVESVIAADQAAGGAPPESDQRVLQFGFSRLRHRGRGVTLVDLEDLALQSSPMIVQARAFAGSGSVRLAVVLRGTNPVPNASQVRELQRLLADSTPITLGGAGVLRIVGPRVRKLKLILRVRVQSLDHAGGLAEQIKNRLIDYFDSAIGGDDSTGWQLGSSPNADDVAFALADTPNLESIEPVKLIEVLERDVEVPWPQELGATELAVLTEDPVEIHFETMEAAL